MCQAGPLPIELRQAEKRVERCGGLEGSKTLQPVEEPGLCPEQKQMARTAGGFWVLWQKQAIPEA